MMNVPQLLRVDNEAASIHVLRKTLVAQVQFVPYQIIDQPASVLLELRETHLVVVVKVS